MLNSLVSFISSLLGSIALILLCMFFVLAVLYKLRNTALHNSKSRIDFYDMPLMRPVPISTAGFKGLDKFLMLLFSIRCWRIEDAFTFTYEDKEYLIPAGFEFSGTAMPRPLWAVLSSTGLLLIPALIHEYGYRYNVVYIIGDQDQPILTHQNKSKEFWDDLFGKLEIESNGIPLLNIIIKFCLKIGGEKAWEGFRAKSEIAPSFKWSLEPFEVNNESYILDNEPLSADNEFSQDIPSVDDDLVLEHEPFDDNEIFVSGKTKTRIIGYENPNRQKVLGTRAIEGSDQKQAVYKIECLACHNIYGSHALEIYRRKCPNCQDGKLSTPY